ncbi:MAG: proliferating cell nuclear antigen (pcna) [Nanoarchaeota archaeon]|nr:proliferating cell nuclear antigen (pcna) [Nanoarchaeota archaeon]
MKLVLAETKLIKDSISIISEIVTEARFKVTKDTIELIAMDPANVAMVIFKLLSSAFVEYDLKEEVNLAINLNDLKQVFRRIKADDTMTMEMVSNKFKITLKGAHTRTFTLPLIDVEEKEQKVPDLSFAAKITTYSSVLTEAIEDMDIIGESVSFIVDKKTLHVSSSSDLSDADVEVKSSKETVIEATEKLKSKYSIEYLKKMIQGAKLADNVVIQLSKDYPLKIDYLVVDKLQLSFILAPRVDND